MLPHINPLSHATIISGKLMPALKKLFRSSINWQSLGAAIVSVTDWQDICLLLLLGFGTPLFRRLLPQQQHRQLRRFGITQVVSDVSKVGLSVYVVDIAMVVASHLGFTFPRLWKVSALYTKIAYSAWVLREFLLYKCMLLCRFYNVKQSDMGRIEILNRLINGASVFIFGLLLIDWLSLELGYAIKSIFGLASVFSVAFTLASKDILSNLLAGFWLQGSGKALPGDSVSFGDGTSGGLVNMGWLETSLRDGEGVIVKIPNAKLADQKMSNLSQVKKSAVKQTLRFHYSDADKMPELIAAIRQEIMTSCKKLVLDGSRPFRVHFTNYKEDHLEVTVVTHHDVSPVSGEYHDNRQDVLLAINRAVIKSDVEFAQLVKLEVTSRDSLWRVAPSRKHLYGLDDAPNGEEKYNARK
jgi:small-conductance mechanosensitive channel